MIPRLLVACLAAMLMLLSQPVKADPAAEVQKAIQTIYDAQDAAIVNHDIDQTMVPYAEDALFLNDLTGTESGSLAAVRLGWLHLFQTPDQTLTSASRQIKEVTVSKTHKEATLLTLHRLNLSVKSRSGKVVAVEVDELTRHYWVKSLAGWQIEQERITSVDTFRDGKLVRHNHKPVS